MKLRVEVYYSSGEPIYKGVIQDFVSKENAPVAVVLADDGWLRIADIGSCKVIKEVASNEQ